MEQNIYIAGDNHIKPKQKQHGQYKESVDSRYRMIIPALVTKNVSMHIQNDMYRCELSGILVGKYVLKNAMEKVLDIQTNVTLACDKDNHWKLVRHIHI